MTQYEKLAINLSRARQDYGKTQQDVAKYLGISPQAVSNWERGCTKIDSVSLLKLMLWFDVDIYDFLDRCGFEVMHKLNSTTPVLEKSLLSVFYEVNEQGQKYIIKQAEFAATQDEYRVNPGESAKSVG